MIRFIRSLFGCPHRWGWPRSDGKQSCVECGATRKARVDLQAFHSTAAIPRYEPRATAEAQGEKVAVIRKRRKAGSV